MIALVFLGNRLPNAYYMGEYLSCQAGGIAHNKCAEIQILPLWKTKEHKGWTKPT
jgi:hypothetical protein